MIILLAHNIRSTHNVGAFFRTCDGLGVEKIIFSGYTPYPKLASDTRLPHFADKITRQIHKTALGAETTVDFERFEDIDDALSPANDAVIVALEQYKDSMSPSSVAGSIALKHSGKDVVLLVGNEIHGVDKNILKRSDYVMEIPMKGDKESLNVSVATAIALYELTKESI